MNFSFEPSKGIHTDHDGFLALIPKRNRTESRRRGAGTAFAETVLHRRGGSSAGGIIPRENGIPIRRIRA